MPLNWKALQVGDPVAVTRKFGDGIDYLEVERVLKTQIVLSDGTRWSRNGYEFGTRNQYSRYRRTLITVHEGKAREKEGKVIRKRHADNHFLSHYQWESLSDDGRQKVIALLEELSEKSGDPELAAH
jgi:hypothetical protein